MSFHALPVHFHQVGDPEFMQSFTMNKRPLLVLMEQGFLQRCLQEESPHKCAEGHLIAT